MSEIVSHVLVAVIGFVIGVFVYRNNVKDADPIASKVDKKWDEYVKPKLEELEKVIEESKN